MNGQVFTLDDEPCTRCTCQLGEVSCERIPCQWACADPTLLSGDCCSSCPEFLFAAEEGQGPARLGRLESGKGARSPRGDAAAPVNCSSCPGPPAAPPARPALPLLQLLLGTNLSDTQTSRAEPSGAPASTSPSAGPEGASPGEPGDSQPRALSPGASTPPPAPPGAPWPPPVTPAGPVSASSGTRTAARWPATPLAEASALSTPHSGPSETSTLPLRPRTPARPASRLPAAPAAATRARSRQPLGETPKEEEAVV